MESKAKFRFKSPLLKKVILNNINFHTSVFIFAKKFAMQIRVIFRKKRKIAKLSFFLPYTLVVI